MRGKRRRDAKSSAAIWEDPQQIIADFESCYNARVRTQTSIKLAIAAVVMLLFAGFILRAAMRLAATAMHSLFGAFVILVLIVILFAKR
jgi:hypothetical protein